MPEPGAATVGLQPHAKHQRSANVVLITPIKIKCSRTKEIYFALALASVHFTQ